MKFRKVIKKPIAVNEDGVQIAGGVNAVIDANVGEQDSHSKVSSKQSIRVVQRGGETHIEDRNETSDDNDSSSS